MKLSGLPISLVALCAATTAALADDALSLANLRDLERTVAAYSRSFARCSEFPCPDADCAGLRAARDALAMASSLIGAPQSAYAAEDLSDFERRRKTLGHWMEEERIGERRHYNELLSGAQSKMSKAAWLEEVAVVQKAFTDTSKLAQIVIDLKSLDGLFREIKIPARPPTTLSEIVLVNEILAAGTNMFEVAGMADQLTKDMKANGANEGLPANFTATISFVNAAQAASINVGDRLAAQQAAQQALAQQKQLLDLARKPLDTRTMSRAAAFFQRTQEREALRRAFESNSRKAWAAADKIKSSGRLALLKAATLWADKEQAELRDRIAELKSILSAEGKTLVAQAETLELNEQRRQALHDLKNRIEEARSLLADCEKSCSLPGPPPPLAVPIADFTLPTADAAGKTRPRESYGKAMKWFRGAFADAANAVRRAGPFRIEDSRMSLMPQPQRVGVNSPIVIKAEGSLCLLKRGRVFGDGEERNTSAENPPLTFAGKVKPGEYTYQFALREVFGAGDDRYNTSTVVTVAKDSLVGYWRRTSPARIINGRQEVVEWTKAPEGIVVAEGEGGNAVMAYVPIPNATLATAFTSKFAPKCKLEESRLSCRFEADVGCQGQWYNLEVKAKGEAAVRLKVLGGEVSLQTGQGCQRIPHIFTPFDFTLEREAADGRLQKAYPCPDGFRCQ